MKLLIVDDEKYVIESIKKHICWDRTQISEIYTAFSVKQAQEIMAVSDIDVIISDIVMPNTTGFDFIEWIRAHNVEVQVIFLTSYAEFDYARRAIQLKSVDYLLKPIDYELLEGAIKKAEISVNQEKKRKILEKEHRQWQRNRIILQQDIWKNLLNKNMTAEKFCEIAQQRNLSYQSKDFFKILYFFAEVKEREQQMWDLMTLEFVMQNVLSEFYEKTNIFVDTLFYEDKKQHWVVLLTQNEEKDEPEEEKILKRFIQWVKEHIYSRVWCGIGTWEEIPQLSGQYEKLQKMREDSLSVWNDILYMSQFQSRQTEYENTELELWKVLLKKENTDELITQIREYVNKKQEGEIITRDFLRSLRTDLTQLVYVWLSERGIKAYALFSDSESEELSRNALDGGAQIIAYSENLIRRAIGYCQYVKTSASVANQLCTYIDAHYQKEIHRDELAELVFLNTDYMSRIFKKEKGISISAYILKKRVEEAKKLLVQSNLPINIVSLYVGYSNFSYFTKMFKDNTGYTPLEYRRMKQEDSK